MATLDPILVGSGGAGQALRQALAMYPEEIGPVRQWPRGQALPAPDPERSLLVLANPHALHTPYLLEAAELGYRWAICEKPAAVSLEQVAHLEGLPIETWICHGYRLLWGAERLREAWSQGRFGEVMCVEGRYWQSGAVRGPAVPGWKDIVELGGSHDVLLDLGTHWVDLMIFLTGRHPAEASVRKWYGNAASSHRDTHVHIRLDHGGITSFGSVSKTVHGIGNHLEIHILGELARASWSFSEPDVLVWGRGTTISTEVRSKSELPARLAPFHGLGWLEGYARLVGDLVGHVCHGRDRHGPSLEEQVVVLRTLLEADSA